VYDLSALGFGPSFQEQLTRWASGDVFPARVAAEHRGVYEVWSSAGAARAQLAGRLRVELENGASPGVGDWVALKELPSPERTTIIHDLFAQRTVFTRGAAGRQARAQVIAANVDLVFVACGLDEDFNVRRIERYVARIWASGARPIVILNKADLCENAEARVLEIETRCPGVPVYVTSAIRAEGLGPIRASIGHGLTAAFVGSSGAGKSTLVNALLGERRMATAEVRASDGRGRHTTTRRQLVLLSGGGLLLDTPGMRELQIVDEAGLGAVFEDITLLAARCRFRDCRHDSEPGCAVKEAIASGEMTAERLEHFHKLEREAQSHERRHNERLRRESERAWGRLSDEAARSRRRKRGE